MTHSDTGSGTPAPGDRLRDELVARHMSQAELARRMGRPVQVVSELVNKKKALTEETALELERVLGVPASDWVLMEGEYQLALARTANAKRLRAEPDWANLFPVREMERRGWIAARSDPYFRAEELLRFFGVASFSVWEEQQRALGFRITGKGNIDAAALAAWVRRGERLAEGTQVSDYSERRFRRSIELARTLTKRSPRSAWLELRESCAAAGVVAVVVPEFPRIGANGVAKWLTPTKAMIELNRRYKWEDVFWFTFFHEAAHILMHEPRRVFIDLDGNPHRDPREAEANRLAEELLIPTEVWEQFVLRSEFDHRSISRTADSLGIHPGIVVGRLQHSGLVSWSSPLNSLRDRLDWDDVEA